jgi:hypothetical protein
MGMHGVGKKFLFSFFGISALLFVPVYLLHDFEMDHNFVLLFVEIYLLFYCVTLICTFFN